jgi:MFS family permease
MLLYSNPALPAGLRRIPTVLQHAVLAARTIVTARSSGQDRARLLGYLGVAYGVGFAFGPALGGLLSQVSLRLGSWLATGGSLLSVVLIYLLLEDGV